MQIGVESQRAVENKRVFIVDTNEVSSLALQFMLADDYEAHIFAEPASALKKGEQWPPHLFMVGIGTLLVEGPNLINTLLAKQPQAKIVVVCDAIDEVLVAQALALGAHATLTRPLRLETVRRKADSQLGRRVELRIPVHFA